MSLGFHEPQLKPVSPDPVDDEFEGEALDEAWAWETAPDSHAVGALESWLTVTLSTAKSCRLVKSFAPDGAFGLEAMLSMAAKEMEDSVGLAVLDGDENMIVDLVLANLLRKQVFYSGAPGFGGGGANLVLNPSFEEAIGDEWTVVDMARDSTWGGADGDYYARGRTDLEPTATQYARYVRQDVSIGAGDFGLYRFACSLRIPLSGPYTEYARARARLRDPNALTVFETPVHEARSWRQYSKLVEVAQEGNWQVWGASFATSTLVGWEAVGHCDHFQLYRLGMVAAPRTPRVWLRLARQSDGAYVLSGSGDAVTWRRLHVTDPITTDVAGVALTFDKATAGRPAHFGVNYVRAFPYALPRL